MTPERSVLGHKVAFVAECAEPQSCAWGGAECVEPCNIRGSDITKVL